jgi:starch phosphorylase
MKPLNPEALSFLTVHDLGMDKESIKLSFANHIEYTQGKDQYSVTPLDSLHSLMLSVRDRMYDRWNKTQQEYYRSDKKRVYYLSMEFLIGRLLHASVFNLDIVGPTRQALEELGLDLTEICDQEWEPGLGNGGLGRLAACFLDSMATLGIPAIGYGIRYEYGIFRQALLNGQQVEHPDNWLRYGTPWETARPSQLHPVRFYGRVTQHTDREGRLISRWEDCEEVMALAYDVLVPGYRNERVNTLRLWSAKATREFDLRYFNHGDYIQAVHDKNLTENITRVLYPDDSRLSGRELRLKQEYLLVSASIQDALTRHLKTHADVHRLPHTAVFQLNDTHPAMAIPELMRILLDDYLLAWEEAWAITRRCFAYTNHTILPEALEKWPVEMLERMLPRHTQIIYEINRRFLDEVRALFPGDDERVRRVSLVDEGPPRQMRMANLAVVGSFSVNGVSALHTELIRTRLFADFNAIYPDRFNNKTNGITPRRWLMQCNPELSALITEAIGDRWVRDLDQLQQLESHATHPEFQQRWLRVKQTKKQQLADWTKSALAIRIDPASLFDVQVKRIHEYKRQLLNILHVISLYHRLIDGKVAHPQPRTFLFAGKAAPAYDMAKRIIRLIVEAGAVIHADPRTKGLLQVVFLPNYNVSLAERIMPAADISEQISTAGMEASGTGNMKLSLNGALTVGTLDGANVEIREAVGAENFFLFGLTAQQVLESKRTGYRPAEFHEKSPILRRVLDSLIHGEFSGGSTELFRPIVHALLEGGDPFMVLADFESYCLCHAGVDAVYQNREEWARRSILNVAKMGRFSSDKTIAEYARGIWSVPVDGAGGIGHGD